MTMAKIPTREESGRRILAIYKQDGARANEMILLQSWHSRFTDSQWRAVDFNAGLEWCIEKRFLRHDEQKAVVYFLTTIPTRWLCVLQSHRSCAASRKMGAT
jgi:hypothetical protein